MIYKYRKSSYFAAVMAAFMISGCGQTAERRPKMEIVESAAPVEKEPGSLAVEEEDHWGAAGNVSTDFTSADSTTEDIDMPPTSVSLDKGQVSIGDRVFKIIENQSFQVNLEGWGDIFFVSCEPSEALDTPHFFLTKGDNILFSFPWADSGQEGVFDGVRFVAFPDIDGDGRKDVVISAGKLSGTAAGGGSSGILSVYYNQGDRFDRAETITRELRNRWEGGDPDYGSVIKDIEIYEDETSNKAIRFAKNVQEYVRTDNREALASVIRFPIDLYVGDERMTLRERKDFIEHYDDIVHASFRQPLYYADTEWLDADARGYSLWELFWFEDTGDRKFMIYKINNEPGLE